MAFTINSIQVTGGSKKSGESLSVGTGPRFSVNRASSQSDTSSITTGVSAEDRARRSATLELSGVASSLNSKENLTSGELSAVQSLLAKAQEIKKETNPTRRDSIASDATALIDSTSTQYDEAVTDDATLAETNLFQLTVDSEVPVGNSERQFTVSIEETTSLSSLGISSSLSFESDDIDATISTLQSAAAVLDDKLSSYSSVRTGLAAEVNSRGKSAGLTSGGSSESAEEIASRLTKSITSSVNSLLASSKVGSVNVESLLSDASAIDELEVPSSDPTTA